LNLSVRKTTQRSVFFNIVFEFLFNCGRFCQNEG